MAYRYRKRGRRSPLLSRRVRQYIDAFLFLTLGPAVVGAISWFVSIIPPMNITIGPIAVSNTLFLQLIGFGAGIALIITGIHKLRIRI